MTQPTEAVGGATNDTVVAAEPTIEDRFAAHFADDRQEEEPGEQQDPLHPDDAAALEAEVAEEELAEADLDDADLPPISPPVSFTAEEKEAFATWPRDAQEAVTRRVGDIEKGFHAKVTEAKAATAKVEQQAREKIDRLNAVHVQALQAMLPEVPPRPDPRLNINDPVGYANQLANYEWAVTQHQQAQQLVQHVAAQQQADERAAAEQEAKDNEAILRDKFPEYFAEGAAELEKGLRSNAMALGYSEDQLAHVNAQDVLAMREASQWKAKADKYDTLMAKQMQKVRDAKALPKVSRPGTAQGKGAIQNQRYEADRNAMRSGDRDAEARVFGRFV